MSIESIIGTIIIAGAAIGGFLMVRSAINNGNK